MSRQSYSANQYSGGGSSSRSTSAPAGGASAGGNYGGDSSGGVSANNMSGAGGGNSGVDPGFQEALRKQAIRQADPVYGDPDPQVDVDPRERDSITSFLDNYAANVKANPFSLGLAGAFGIGGFGVAASERCFSKPALCCGYKILS